MMRPVVLLSLVFVLLVSLLGLSSGCTQKTSHMPPELKQLMDLQFFALEYLTEELESAESPDDCIAAMDKCIANLSKVMPKYNLKSKEIFGFTFKFEDRNEQYDRLSTSYRETWEKKWGRRLQDGFKKMSKYQRLPRMRKAFMRFSEKMEVINKFDIFSSLL